MLIKKDLCLKMDKSAYKVFSNTEENEKKY